MSSPNQQHFVGQHQPNIPVNNNPSPQIAQNPFQQQINEEVRPENVALEFVNQSSIGAGVDSAADFFNNLRIGDDPLEGPGYTSSISAFNPLLWAEKMDSLRNSSVQHANTLTTKQRWEHEAIDMHNGVWRFTNEQRRATGICGCGNNVVYSYGLRVASLNDALLPLLGNKFQDLHHFNTRPVYLSLFEQTTNEMAVTRYLYSCKHLVTGKYQQLKVILEQLLGALNTSTVQGVMSMHTTNVLQTLVQYFGALLLQAANSNNNNTPSLLLDMGEVQQALPKYIASEFLFKKLLDVKGLSWGCALTHPAIREVVDMSYVIQLFDANLDELQYTAFLEQIVWAEVATLTEAEVVAAFLNPFQKGMEKAVRGNMIKLLLLMSRILVIISHYHPRLTLQSLALMTRSPWPSKILTAPLLAALSWGTLGPQELILVFIELYHLFGKRVEEYAAKSDQDKALHRHSMGHMMLANQHLLTQAYQVDPPLAAINYGVRYPHLALYRRLALYYLRVAAAGAQDLPDLAGTILDELFYFGFVYQGLPVGTGPGPSNPPPPPDLHAWMPYLKNEACVQLSLLCRAAPALASRLVRLLMQHLAGLNIAQVIQFLSQTPTPPLAHFVLNLDSLNALSYLITQKTLPPAAAVDNPQTIDSIISLCVFTPVKSQFPPAIAQAGLQLGLKLFDAVRWEQVAPSVRMKAILVILSARHVARDWSWKYLLTTNNRKLTSAPFETVFVHKLFQVDPNQGGDELLVAQILLALGMADDQYRSSNTGGVDWLNKWGLFAKLTVLLDKKRYDLLRALLVPVMHTLKMEPIVSIPHLTNIVLKLLTQDRASVDGLRRVMISTLADGSPPESHAQWVQIWALLLTQKAMLDNHCALLETLIYGYYCECTGNLHGILQHLGALEATRKNLSRFSGKYPFITLSILHRFNPRLPPLRPIKDVDKITKETALWLTKEEAQGIKDPVLALVYWDAFFHIYFSGEPGFDALPPSAREALNKHFNNVINNSKGLDETLISIYYSFNTWRDSILFRDARIFSNPVAWDALCKTLPGAPYALGAPVPPPALAQQHAQQLFNSDLEYISALSADLDNAKVVALVPPRRSDPFSLVESENTRHQAFTQSVSSTLASLAKQDETKVRAVEDLYKLLRRYTTLKSNLQQEDGEFLQLTRQLYFNHATTFSVAVPCATQGYCDYPAQIKCAGVNIGPAYPSVRDDLQRNRGLFNRDYIALFDVARSIAYIVALLEETVLALVQAASTSAAAGTQLFFAVAPILLESLPPQNSPIFSALTKVAVSLGDKFIKNHPYLQRRLLQMIISKSVKGGEGALVTIKAGKAFNELRSSVFESFSPTCLLHDDEGLQAYLELLHMFVSSTNGLAPSEDMQIASLFAVSANFEMIMTRNPSTIDAILNMIQPLLCKQSLNEFAVEVLTLVMNYQFPRYFEPVLERLLTLSVQKLITTPWTALLDPIAPRISSLDESVALQLLSKTIQYIPTPPPFFAPILFLAHRLLQNAGILQGILEGKEGYWELVLRCLGAATRQNSVYFPLNSEDFGSVMIFIKDLLICCPVLVDRVWDLFRAIVFPYLHADRGADISTAIKYLNEIPAHTWDNATFHTHPATLRDMAQHLSGEHAARCSGLVCHIVSKLDWSKIAGRNDAVTLLAFLRLYLCSTVIRGSNALGQSARDFARHASWAQIDEDALMREFTGDVFVRLLRDGILCDEDSTKPILDALKQLYEFSDNSGSLPLSAACMREARSFIRASFKSPDSGAYWCIPLPDQVSIVATILIPLARRATQRRTTPNSPPLSTTSSSSSSQPNPYTREMLVAILSTASAFWPDTISAPMYYAHDPAFYGDEAAAGGSKYQEFSRKIDGLILQFCGSSPAELALAIVQAAIFARLEPNMHMQVLEEALHSYFIHAHSDADQEAEYAEKTEEEGQGYKGVPGDKGREILTRAALAITLPADYPWNEFVEKCITGQALITARVLLENQKLHVVNMPALQRIGVATDLVTYASRCIPIATREFDIYAIWFFALDVIQDPRWIRSKKSDESSKLFHRHLTLFASPSSIQQLLASMAKVGVPQSTPSPNVQLAAKACLLYLEKLLTSKKPVKQSNELSRSGGNVRMPDFSELDEIGERESGGGGKGREKEGGGGSSVVANMELNTIRASNADDDSLLHPEIGAKKDKELFEMAEKLYALRNDPAYAGQEEFFAQIQNILSPLFDFNHFRNTVVRSLAPIALYLEIL